VTSVLKSDLSTIFEGLNLERVLFSAVVHRTVVAWLVLSWRRCGVLHNFGQCHKTS